MIDKISVNYWDLGSVNNSTDVKTQNQNIKNT